MIRGKEFVLKLFLLSLLITACSSGVIEITPVKSQEITREKVVDIYKEKTKVGAVRLDLYLPLLKDKRVGIVSNQASIVGSSHLVDTLLSLGIDVKIVFSPEHGFRGNHSAGANIKHEVDDKTGLSIFSLHGKTKKPSKESLDSIDLILFDLQDVGVRFYTYISTLHYVMEAAAENNKKVIVLDRPNPNAHYIDGPVLDAAFKSFIGMHPVPVVYGMTIGEYAQMINGEFWMKDSAQVDLSVIPLQNWTYDKAYILPIAPSPNLPNQLSIYLYPSLCFFEGTEVSIGRGTDFPFQVWGHPNVTCKEQLSFTFKPISMPGKSKYPKHENKYCIGDDLRGYSADSLRANPKLEVYQIQEAFNCVNPNKEFFDRSEFFNLLAGNKTFLTDLKAKKSEDAIRKSWKNDLDSFKLIRLKYLLYK
ncbi:MAG: hypothetical protein ACI9U0_002426 [Flavobacteriales bacterium]|jgi:uncharacterized protein YbbC (DUF1343 family)